MLAAYRRLTAVAVVAASERIAGAITVAARGTVAAAIVAEAAFRTAWLSLACKTLAAGMPAKTLSAAHTRCMRNIYPGTGMTPGAVAVGLPVPLTMAFFRVPGQMSFGTSGMAMAAVRG